LEVGRGVAGARPSVTLLERTAAGAALPDVSADVLALAEAVGRTTCMTTGRVVFIGIAMTALFGVALAMSSAEKPGGAPEGTRPAEAARAIAPRLDPDGDRLPPG